MRRITGALFLGLMKKIFNYFTIFEFLLWVFSVVAITFSFVFFDGQNYLRLVASIVGVSAILITSKGNVFGQILMLGFCVIYGYISYGYSYYGEGRK